MCYIGHIPVNPVSPLRPLWVPMKKPMNRGVAVPRAGCVTENA